jgi:hypothetical protein
MTCSRAIRFATSGVIHAVVALAFAWTLPALPSETRQRTIDVSFERMTAQAAATGRAGNRAHRDHHRRGAAAGR